MRTRLPISTIPTSTETDDVKLLFGQFLDDYRHADLEEKAYLLRDEPEWMERQNGRWSYILAATAEALAHEAGIEPPGWVYDTKYVSPVPIYGGDVKLKEYQELLKETALPEFAARNLYMGDNVLTRY